MAISKNDILDIDLSGGTVHRDYTNHMLGGGDNAGNTFGVRLTRNGTPVSLIGASCVGFFIRMDGITLIINGETSENEAYVVLPQAAYAKAGQFTLSIKVSGTGFADTMRIVDGTVVETTTGDIADPAQDIPSLADLIAIISAAEDAADTIDELSVTATQITGTRYKIAVTKE